ncbi:MAG TPA: hypothetical protein VI895_04250 [Bdellovibrionota bacterium]|nr:hypothetical protein [Bdellovibrionota bacterium]
MTNEIDRNYQNRRTKRVLGFLAAKGLLIVPWVKARPTGKLRVPDVLWVAKNVEPRVLEVLPAALLHFPAAFLQKDRLPKDVRAVLAQIKKGEKADRMVRGIPFKNFQRWTERILPDRRTKPLSRQRRITKSFRFPQHIAEGIRQQASLRGLGESQYLESLVRKDLAP